MSEKEIQQLKEKINNLNITLEKMIKTNEELGIKLHDKDKQLQQRDSIIEEAIKILEKIDYEYDSRATLINAVFDTKNILTNKGDNNGN